MRSVTRIIEEPHPRGTRVVLVPGPQTRTQVRILGNEPSVAAVHPGATRPDALNTRVKILQSKDVGFEALAAVELPSDPRERLLLAIETEERAAEELDKQAERLGRKHADTVEDSDKRITSAHDALSLFDAEARTLARDEELEAQALRAVASAVDGEGIEFAEMERATRPDTGDTETPPEESNGDG